MEMVLQFSFLVFLQFVAPAISLNDEGLALLSFKQALKHSSAGYLDNWNSSATTPCSWNGIHCREEKVISLNLYGKGLLGSLYLDGGKLAALHHVNLGNNHFYGSLPVELLNATALKYLVLEENSFSGPVPPEISNLRYIQNLDLSDNYFNNSLTKSLVHCRRLKRLALGGNSFNGSLPDGFGTNLVVLQGLNLSFNNFSGLIPTDLGNLSSLQGVLDMSHNQFNGTIPASLSNLPRTVYINLAYNNLTGPIPQNGALENAGPTAFLGNPLLCGPPLKVSCPLGPKPIADKPSETSCNSNGKKGKGNGRTPWIMITAVSGTVIGMCLIGLSFSYWFRKNHASRNQNHAMDCTLEERPSIRKEMFCFRTDDLESLSENVEQYTFIPLDQGVSFDLEQLLKASAFLLGKSRRGIVYKVVLEKGPMVAVRRLENGGSRRLREFQAEVETVGKIRHPNIVSLLAYCWCINEKLLIYDYIPNGDLATALHGPPGRMGTTYLKPLSWSARQIIMKGVAKGLAFLHDFSPKRFVHGNLKPSNILLGKNMEPYICDIGLTCFTFTTEELEATQSEQSAARTPQPGSPYSMTPTTLSTMGYEAPEASKAMKPSQKWDVYSFGVILLEMMSGKLPGMQMGSSEMDLVQWIQLGIEVKPLVDILDPFLAHDLENTDEIVAVLKIALACVHVNPDKRPSMRNVSDTLERLALST